MQSSSRSSSRRRSSRRLRALVKPLIKAPELRRRASAGSAGSPGGGSLLPVKPPVQQDDVGHVFFVCGRPYLAPPSASTTNLTSEEQLEEVAFRRTLLTTAFHRTKRPSRGVDDQSTTKERRTNAWRKRGDTCCT
eukprot:6912601-Prymnesium_polylepis.1